LTRHAAAAELGISERMLAYYEAGERPVPRAVMLAIHALAAGLDDGLQGKGQARERWVVLVRNVLDYAAGVPVVGRMLRARDHLNLADFLEFVRQGPEPDMALTDPALFRSLREVVTRAKLAGPARYRINEKSIPRKTAEIRPSTRADDEAVPPSVV